MKKEAKKTAQDKPKAPNIFGILVPYRIMIAGLVVLALGSNALTLLLPKLISGVIDGFISGTLALQTLVWEFGSLSLGIFFLTYLQSIVQTYSSERVGRDMRADLIAKISTQSYRFIDDKNPAKLLTNLTADIDSIKLFVAQAVVSLVSSAVIIVGAAAILLSINWKLGLAVLMIIPLIGVTFFIVLGRVRALFLESRGVIDWLNKVINESIMGAALIRVLNSGGEEGEKFTEANAKARDIGVHILRLFSFMIPIITFVASLGTLTVVALGGYFVIEGTMTLGSFAAFNSYIVILIFPILIIGFMSNVIAQAGAAYTRIYEILEAPDVKAPGTIVAELSGAIEVKDITVTYGEKPALRDVSISIQPHSKTAIIGPTAAGKTQLLNAMVGLLVPKKGEVIYDSTALTDFQPESFYRQIGLVFQDSILFNTTMRENIAFSLTTTDEQLKLAIDTAELGDFIAALPDGLDTVVSERGTSLSGGQKQRIMLARALAMNPKILFLDDFTARVDTSTEAKILANLSRNYPDLTLVSVTQKISSIEHYEQIILLMEGEVLARGTHEELLHTSPEYVQIFESQRSTNAYELRT